MGQEFGRKLRLAEQIKRELAPLVSRTARDARLGLVTVTAVDLTADLHDAKVYVSCLGGSAQEVVARLKRAAGCFRTVLARRLSLRAVPRLLIHHDETLERIERLAALLKGIHSGGEVPHSR